MGELQKASPPRGYEVPALAGGTVVLAHALGNSPDRRSVPRHCRLKAGLHTHAWSPGFSRHGVAISSRAGLFLLVGFAFRGLQIFNWQFAISRDFYKRKRGERRGKEEPRPRTTGQHPSGMSCVTFLCIDGEARFLHSKRSLNQEQ